MTILLLVWAIAIFPGSSHSPSHSLVCYDGSFTRPSAYSVSPRSSEDCLELAQNSAEFDLVGQEDTFVLPLIDYAEQLLRFVDRQKEVDVRVPLMFHTGEILGDVTRADLNLYDAILLGTKRIVHGWVNL